MRSPSGETAGPLVRPEPRGQGADLSIRDRHLVDLAVRRFLQGVLAPVRREHDVGPVGSPGEPAPVMEGAGGELPRRASLGRHHEDLAVAVLQITDAVGAVDHLADDPGGRSPVGVRRLGGERHVGRRRLGHEHGERQPAAVGRPAEVCRGTGKLGQPRRLPAVHPADVDLRRAVVGQRPGRHVGDPVAVRGPPRRTLVTPGLARSQGPMVGAVRAHDPQPGPLAVHQDVHGIADVHHPGAVGRNLRVGGEFEAEHVLELEDREGVLLRGR